MNQTLPRGLRLLSVWLVVSSVSLATLCLAEDPAPAELQLLDGTTQTGEVLSLSSAGVIIRQDGETREIPFERLLGLTWSAAAGPVARGGESYEILLDDGSRVRAQQVTSDGRSVQATSSAFGELELPLNLVRSVRLGGGDQGFADQWNKLLKRTSTDDLLVIKKGDVLDFLPGVITEYNTREVQFLYDGNEIPVKRERVYGLIHSRKPAGREGVLCTLSTTSGDEILLRELTLTETELQGKLRSNVKVAFPREHITRLDFSLGRVVYLSDLEHEGVEHTPYFDTVWQYQRDKTNTGSPLRLGGRVFPKGLWIHSRTALTYRLAGEYSRLQAKIGIDDAVAENGLGHVRVRIQADDRVLFEEEVSAFDEPRPLDLDLSEARFLRILVDFGEGLDVGDHLVLGDAKLIK